MCHIRSTVFKSSSLKHKPSSRASKKRQRQADVGVCRERYREREREASKSFRKLVDAPDALCHLASGQVFKLQVFLKLTNTDPFAAWFVVSGDATPDAIRVVRSVLGAISSLPVVAFRE